MTQLVHWALTGMNTNHVSLDSLELDVKNNAIVTYLVIATQLKDA